MFAGRRSSVGDLLLFLAASMSILENIGNALRAAYRELRGVSATHSPSKRDNEHALRDRLNLATATAGIVVWDKNLSTGDFVCDDRFGTLFGLTPDDHFKPPRTIHDDERDRLLAPLNQAFADPSRDEILSLRHRTTNPRPEPQYVQTHIRVFRGPEGKPIRLLGVTWDVTEEVLHAEALKRTADQQRRMVERMGVATQAANISPWEFDLKANQYSWIGFRLKALGLDDEPTETCMTALLNLALPEDRHILRDAPSEAIENGVDFLSYCYRINGVDGHVHHLKHFVRILRSPRGTAYRLVGVTWDMSEEVAVGLPHQQLCTARADDHRTVSMPLASGAVLQMDQATSSYQAVLRYVRKRGEDTNLDRRVGVRLDCHRQEETGHLSQPLRNATDLEPNHV
jgi:hypothetical protein